MCFQTSSPLKPLGRLKPNFIYSLLWTGKRKFVQTVLVILPRWPPCPYTGKTLKIFFSDTKRMTMKLGIQHRVLQYYQVYSNDNPGLTLTYFTARSHLVPYAFVWENGKTMDFSETIVVYDVKVCICTYMNNRGQGHSLTFVQGRSDSTFSNFFFLRNRLVNLSQISYGAFIG